MAEQLKRRYDIVVLKIELRYLNQQQAEVHFTFQYQVDGQLEDANHWQEHISFPSEQMNIPVKGQLSAWEAFELPTGMVAQIKDWIEQEHHQEDPLWIHLVKPYGPLRVVFWERVLGRELPVPILMLPDFIFPRPREDDSILEIALCASAPLRSEVDGVTATVENAIHNITAGPDKDVRIHVFADGDVANSIRNLPPVASRDVIVYDFQEFEEAVSRESESKSSSVQDSLRSPWLIWIRNALANHSIDVAHFICHGYLTSGRGSLLFAPSPSKRTSSYLTNPVSGPELRRFLTQIGAWSTVFTSLPDNESRFGLRVVADDIAQSRPGPMMLHYRDRDLFGSDMKAGYKFLYGGRASKPPKSNSLLIYCQPYLVAGAESDHTQSASVQFAAPRLFSRNEEQRTSIDRAMQPSPVMDYVFSKGNVSPLVSSTERYAEQVQLKYQQLNRDELLVSEDSKRSMEIALETVHKLQMAVAAHGLGEMQLDDAIELNGLITLDGALTKGTVRTSANGEVLYDESLLSTDQLDSILQRKL